MKNNLLFVLAILVSLPSLAQVDLFRPYAPKAEDDARYQARTTPQQATTYTLTDPTELAEALAKTPRRNSFTNGAEVLLRIPSPTGETVTFRILRYQMITDELQAFYPDWVTAEGWDVNAPHRRIRLSWTAQGFNASVTGGEEGRWYLTPRYHGQRAIYHSYFTADYPQRKAAACGFEMDDAIKEEIAALGHAKFEGDCTLREYRLALACTGQYFQEIAGIGQDDVPTAADEAAVVAEMIVAINRVNQVFATDLAIQLNLINLPNAGGNIQLVYSDTITDPYSNFDGSAMLAENQATCTAVIGAANYDIGHVFSTGGGGIAALDSPCSTEKAQGVTGLPNPVGDPFYIDFVAHEVGHQFGGDHTFNSTEENCATRVDYAAYEPGGGTTIQAYAGICGPQANIQLNSDPYYHAFSIQQIFDYMAFGGGNSCVQATTNTNTEPAVNAGLNYTIPLNTPFVLTAVGTDLDGDAITYCWEQFDLGPVVAGPPTGNEKNAPLFRSLPPVPAPERYFPSLADVVAGNATPWEVLPLTGRTMNFIVTLRDLGSAGYGCPVQDEMVVTAVNTGTQYAVLAPNGGEVFAAGQVAAVSWEVAGTDQGLINCPEVDIILSTDGGQTFDQLLATTDNDGNTNLVMPALSTSSARIMIKCSNGIFYDVSNTDFSIEQNDYLPSSAQDVFNICNGQNSLDFPFELESLQAYTGTITYSAQSLPGAATASFSPNSVTLAANAQQTVMVTLNNLGALAAGNYPFQVITTDDGGTTNKTLNFTLSVGQGDFSVVSPADGAVQAPTDEDGDGQIDDAVVTVNFQAFPGASSYQIDFDPQYNPIGLPGNFAGANINLTLPNVTSGLADATYTLVVIALDGSGAEIGRSCEQTITFSPALPVDWLSFTATREDKVALLNWSVIQDEAHAGFTLERKIASATEWASISYLGSTGANGRADYAYTDLTVRGGDTYLYRLRQEDFDGTTDYSEIRSVSFSGTGSGLSIFPNPSREQSILTVGSAVPATGLRYVLFSPLGQQILTGTLTDGRARINLAQLPAAIYQVLVTDDAGYREVVKLVKR